MEYIKNGEVMAGQGTSSFSKAREVREDLVARAIREARESMQADQAGQPEGTIKATRADEFVQTSPALEYGKSREDIACNSDCEKYGFSKSRQAREDRVSQAIHEARESVQTN